MIISSSGYSPGYSTAFGGIAPLEERIFDRIEWLLFRYPQLEDAVKPGNRYVLRTREQNFPDDPDSGQLPDCLLVYRGQTPNNLASNTSGFPVLDYSIEIRTDTFAIRDVLRLGQWVKQALVDASTDGGPRLGASTFIRMAVLTNQTVTLNEKATRWSITQMLQVTAVEALNR